MGIGNALMGLAAGALEGANDIATHERRAQERLDQTNAERIQRLGPAAMKALNTETEALRTSAAKRELLVNAYKVPPEIADKYASDPKFKIEEFVKTLPDTTFGEADPNYKSSFYDELNARQARATAQTNAMLAPRQRKGDQGIIGRLVAPRPEQSAASPQVQAQPISAPVAPITTGIILGQNGDAITKRVSSIIAQNDEYPDAAAAIEVGRAAKIPENILKTWETLPWGAKARAHKIELANARASRSSTTINNIPLRREIKFGETLGKEDAEALSAMNTAYNTANTTQQTSTRMLELTDPSQPNPLKTGRLTPLITEIVSYGRAFGVNEEKMQKLLGFGYDPNKADEFNKLSKDVVLDLAAKMKGSLSDKDVTFLTQAAANLGTNDRAARILAAGLANASMKAKEQQLSWDTYWQKNGGEPTDKGWQNFMADWRRKLNSDSSGYGLVPQLRADAKSVEKYNSLPAGMWFIDDTGTVQRKD